MELSPDRWDDEAPVTARIPADLDAPDRIVAGLSVHQGAVLAAVAGLEWLAWRVLRAHLPGTALTLALTSVAAAAVVIVMARRDGLALDTWLLAAARFARSPRRLTPTESTGSTANPFVNAGLPTWAPTSRSTRGPAPLRLPARAIHDDGVIETGPGSALVLVSASTLSIGLQTAADQAVVLAAYGRWLNSLTGPVQVVISNRPVDLGSRALRLAQNSHHLADVALARAAIDQAEFLLDLAEDTPLARTLTLVCTSANTPTGTGSATGHRERHGGRSPTARSVGLAGIEATRRAQRTAEALTALGSRCQILDGPEASAALTAACQPFGPTDASWPRTPPASPVTSHVTSSFAANTPWDPTDQAVDPFDIHRRTP